MNEQITKMNRDVTVSRENRIRFKVTYDLSEALASCVQDISTDLGCSQSDVVAHLLVMGIKQYQDGHLNLRAIRRPHSFQLRFAYKLPPPPFRFVSLKAPASGNGE